MIESIQKLIDQFKQKLGRGVHIVEFVMTLGVFAMSFVLIAMMLIRLIKTPDKTTHRDSERDHLTPHPNAEIPLGDFKYVFNQGRVPALSAGKLHIMQLEATALTSDHRETSWVEDTFIRYKNRVQTVVDTVARSATSDEIDEPGLHTFRNRIRTEVNSVIGRKGIEEVVVSDSRYFHL